MLPGRQYLHNQYVKRVHGKHTCTPRLEDDISITGGEAPGQTHTTLRLEDGTCQPCSPIPKNDEEKKSDITILTKYLNNYGEVIRFIP